MLRQLQPGMWSIRHRDGTPPRRICLRSGTELLSLWRSGARCQRIIVDDRQNLVTVQYSCRGDGYTRTSIRRESDTLVQIDTQGVRGGAPFSLAAEARRVGAC